MKLRLTSNRSLTGYLTYVAARSTLTQASVEVERMCFAKGLSFEINYTQPKRFMVSNSNVRILTLGKVRPTYLPAH